MMPARLLAAAFSAALLAFAASAGSYRTGIRVSRNKACLDSGEKVAASVAHTCWNMEGDHMEMRLRRDGEVVAVKGKGGVHSLPDPLPDTDDFPDLSQYVFDIPGDYGFSIDAAAVADGDGRELETATDGTETVQFCRWFSATVEYGEGCPPPVTVTLDNVSDNYDGMPWLSLGVSGDYGFSVTCEPTREEFKRGWLLFSGLDGEWGCDYSVEIPLGGCDPDRDPGSAEVSLDGGPDLSVFAACARKGAVRQTATLRVKASEWDDSLLDRSSVQVLVRDAAPNARSFSVSLAPPKTTDATNPVRCTRDAGGLALIDTPAAQISLTNYPSGGYEIASLSKADGARLWSFSVVPRVPAGADTNLVRGLRVTESVAGRDPRVWDYVYEGPAREGENHAWSLVSAGLATESEETAYASETARSVRRRVSDPATGAPASDTLAEERLFDWGWSRVAETLDPDGAALRTEWAYAESGAGRYGRVTNTVDRYGAATSTEYDELGRVVRTVSPTPAGPHVVLNSYAPLDARDDGSAAPREPRSVTETVGGVVTARRWTVLFERGGLRTRITESAASQSAAFGAPGNARETRVSFLPSRPDRLAGREVLHVAPDGLVRTNAYAYGTLDTSAGDPADWTFTPGADSADGVLRIAAWTTTPSAPGGIPNRTAVDVSCLDRDGREIFSETLVVADGGTPERVAWTATARDALGRPLSVRRSDGSLVETAHGRFGPVWSRDASGAVTTNEYDALGRVTRTTATGGGRPALVTEMAYDAAGRVVSKTAFPLPFNSSTLQLSTYEYDLAGRETRRVSEDGIEETTDYGRLGNTVFYWTRTVRAPAPGRCADPSAYATTNTAYRYKCGKDAWTEFNGARRETYAYGVNPDGTQWVKTWTGPDGQNSPAWTLSTDSFLGGGSACCGGGGGRTASRARPGANGSVLTTTYAYDKVGRVLSETLASSLTGVLSRRLHAYDALGEGTLSAEDLDLDGAIDAAGPDRVTSNATAYVQLDGDWWRESRSFSFPLDGSATPVPSGATRRRLTGLGLPSGMPGGEGGASSPGEPPSFLLASETVTLDAFGNATTNRVWRDRAACATFSVTASPASSLPAVSLSVGGLLVSNATSTGVSSSRTYDGFGRVLSATDGRGNTTAYSYDACGNLVSTTDAAGATTAYAYDPLNRRVSATDPLGNATCTAYDAEDRVIAQWGATYPVLYAYDAFGRLSSLSTTRDPAANQLSTSQLSTSQLASIPWDTTEWRYDSATGLLTNKLYADGLGPSYAYTDDGRLSTRLWARGVLTSYAYDPAGNLTNTTSSGAAANSSFVTRHSSFFSYDRLGRMRSAIVPGVSTNCYSYSLHGQLTNEVQNGVSIARSFDALARPTGYRLMQNGGASPPGEPFAVTYAYDALGHLASVAASSAGSFNFQPSTFNYTRLPGTDLVTGYTSGNFTRSVAYEPHRDLISAVANTASDLSTFQPFNLSTFAYANDAAGRRVEVTRSGAAFGPLAGATDAYGYNGRSEVVSARRAIDGNEILGFGYDYAYDPIGNRLSATEYAESGDALVSSYSANALNQYTRRTVPGTAQVRGFADADADVTVNGNGTWRSGEYFYGGDDADNAAFPVFQELAIEAASPEDEVTAVTGRVFVAQNPERFTYDADGNMLTDGRFRYTWNAENRLVRAQELVAPTNRHPYTVAYAYDHRGRMVFKRITQNDGSDSLVKSISYLWDGWNIIRETATDGNGPTTVTDNVWGLDLDGTLQGAGGVGGLLAVVRDGETYLPTYDANGNVSEYVSTDGSIVAHYDYSPFGETLIETGDLAATFTHRFSTKPWCPVTGLYEYQMRKYRPGIGRWLSRDLLEESDSANLLTFVANQLNAIDKLGLALIKIVAPKPQTIKPLFAKDSDPKKSRTEYENEAVDMECQCAGTNKWQLVCTLSYDIKIYVSKKQALDLGVSLSGIYGHEQRHVLSRELVVRHRVGDLYLNYHRQEFFQTREECEAEIGRTKAPVLFWLKQSLHYPGNHEGDGPEYSNHLSPKAFTEYPLLDETQEWKELK